jgi:hypothetical protein
MILLNAILYIASIVSSAITCLPHESIWQPWISGRCMDRKAIGLATAFFNVIMDLVILLLPQGIIWKLHMSTSRKVGISLIFSVGLLATTCAVGRVAATFHIEYTPGDTTYTVSPVMIWALPELACVMLVFCLPALPKAVGEQGPLFKMTSYIRSWTRLSSPGSRKHSGSTQNAYEHGTGDVEAASQIELKAVEEQPPPMPIKQFRRQEDSAIVKTTEVEQRNSSASRSSAEVWVKRQHPWIESEIR